MNKNTRHDQYAQWSKNWKSLRDMPDVDFKEVLKAWKAHVPDPGYRTTWQELFGYRHNHPRGQERGEQIIERNFLPDQSGQPRMHRLIRENLEIQVMGLAHQMPMAQQRQGQVIADCLGTIQCGERTHPVAVEIKDTHANPWHAVIENLQQVRMLRANVRNVQEFFKNRKGIHHFKGSWGMVLAPKRYFEKHKNVLDRSVRLSDFLRQKTEARIMFVTTDEIGQSVLRHVGGYWPL